MKISIITNLVLLIFLELMKWERLHKLYFQSKFHVKQGENRRTVSNVVFS